eukprot:m.80581 g.80581  ORF g.80581 m.80581 type:complete len:252 (-) comp8625_c0_seq5:44-799(-)
MSGLPFGGYWIVCDMDSTVLERPTSGLFPTLKEGPCFDAMMEWVEGGGSVLLNTTATFRSLAQFWECFPLKYRKLGQVMMSLASGATLVYYHESGKLLGHGKFDEAYMEQEGGQKKTWMEQEIIDKIIDEILPIIQQLHWDMANNHELIELLVVAGVPHALSKQYFGAFESFCGEKYGVSMSFSPNSVWIEQKFINKATPIRYLLDVFAYTRNPEEVRGSFPLCMITVCDCGSPVSLFRLCLRKPVFLFLY